MQKFSKIIMAAMMMVSSVVMADDSACATLADLSYNIMEARQSGASITDMLNVSKNESFYPLYRRIVIAAYETPRFEVESNRLAAAESFKEQMFIACVKKFGG